MDPSGFQPRRPPRPLASTQARKIRRRLLDRVADADTSHLTIDADQGHWQPFLEGVDIKVLREHAGVLSYLLRLAPGAALPPHRHPVDEECMVLQGRLRVGASLEIGPGGYHLAHGGALHATVSSPTGATVFLRGAVPEAEQMLD
jgi:quercetin dioxygenase-like cupin family protein